MGMENRFFLDGLSIKKRNPARRVSISILFSAKGGGHDQKHIHELFAP